MDKRAKLLDTVVGCAERFAEEESVDTRIELLKAVSNLRAHDAAKVEGLKWGCRVVPVPNTPGRVYIVSQDGQYALSGGLGYRAEWNHRPNGYEPSGWYKPDSVADILADSTTTPPPRLDQRAGRGEGAQ